MKDWIIVGGLSCGIGICGISIAGAGGITGRVGVGVLGSTTGAIIGASVVSKLEEKRLSTTISTLKQQEQELQNRVLVINQQNPNLSELEERKGKIEASKIERATLEGQINGLKSQVESLESKRAELNSIESQIVFKQTDLNKLNARIEELTNQSQELEQRAAELRSLRISIEESTIDRSNLEARITQLNSQVESLDSRRLELNSIESQIVSQQVDLNRLDARVQELTNQSLELEHRVLVINQQNPNLPELEDLMLKIGASTIERATLEGQINGLKSQVESLDSKRLELNSIELQIVSQQVDLNRLNTRIEELTNQSQELEQRAADLRSLRISIEESIIDRNNLEARITQLNSQVESLESRRDSKSLELNSIELQIVSQQADLNKLNTRIEELTNQSLELEHRTTELELLRFTYDAILSQKQDYEVKVSQLKPEIDRLELDKQRILQTIEENQNNYQRLTEVREQYRSLTLTIRDQESKLRELKKEEHNLQTRNHNLQTETDNLHQTKREIETTIANLKGEIREIENSGRVALEPLREKLWTNLPRQVRQLEGETQFIQNFIASLTDEGLSFSSRTIKAFHTSLKVQDISALVILAGISGTGKSELPQRYANYIGAQLLTLAVQPRWDSPQDLQGFYNYLEKKFKPTQLMRGLYQYRQPEMRDRIVIVLLDEMNLARVEYYFSEFLSKLESRRNHATYLEIDVGSLPIAESERRLEIPKAFLFVGTMNEDETTQTLSDKVLDRANVLTFGRPQNLKLGQERTVNQHSDNLVNNRDSSYVTYSDFKNWVRTPVPKSDVVKEVEYYLNRANKVMEKMGHPFAHRVYQAIAQYVVNYPEVNGIDSESFRFALADQFGQKLLPKLRGVMVDEAHQQLQEMKEIIDEINDQPLIKAFDKAKEGRYGQFSWQGLMYEDEEA
ncbi:AAA family ATPase [Cylindrospermopsis raciborskii]|uniref:AAA family ATPase n=2 Tax=Cylindrospermopsis raciborskii TaxID=77022 RepID=UPI0022C5D393|nr:AAA family ATPase [Cylindrospermopsis raciborskii]MCZ2205349.1 AAA family ATPase [Cylindrospermopsis raciborskii PAMP2011]